VIPQSAGMQNARKREQSSRSSEGRHWSLGSALYYRVRPTLAVNKRPMNDKLPLGSRRLVGSRRTCIIKYKPLFVGTISSLFSLSCMRLSCPGLSLISPRGIRSCPEAGKTPGNTGCDEEIRGRIVQAGAGADIELEIVVHQEGKAAPAERFNACVASIG
jgi:hypothetical protein